MRRVSRGGATNSASEGSVLSLLPQRAALILLERRGCVLLRDDCCRSVCTCSQQQWVRNQGCIISFVSLGNALVL